MRNCWLDVEYGYDSADRMALWGPWRAAPNADEVSSYSPDFQELQPQAMESVKQLSRRRVKAARMERAVHPR
jgi:hypothetical protein